MAKITKKVRLQLLVALTLASASLCVDCGDNCYKCSAQGNCDACYKRKLVQLFKPPST